MTRFVNRLEALRRKHSSGTPINLMAKAVGNNAYGKTVEYPPGVEYFVCKEPPVKAEPFDDWEDGDVLIWQRPTDVQSSRRSYHRVQIGAFITAAVRCKVFRAAMKAPDAFLFADTDSVAFMRPVRLPISAWYYGRWKRVSSGMRHVVIAKKVYASTDGKIVSKGLHTSELTYARMVRWYRTGRAPVQRQRQLQSWRKGLKLSWRMIDRSGTGGRRDPYAKVREEYAVRLEWYRVLSGVRFTPEYITVHGRKRLRGEYEDIPRKHFVKRGSSLDDVSDQLGMTGDALREELRSLKRPTLKGIR